MFKKVCYLIICVIFGCGFVYAEDETSLAENAKSAIIMEASTGDILFEKNSYEKLPPASMTKIMTMLLIMENIENGNLSWDDEVTASENASSMGGSQIFLEAGEVMSVKDMVKGIAIASGNDAAVAMAEKIAGTEEEFVKYHWNSEVYLLDGRERNYVYFEELHTTIYGISYWKNQIREAVYDDMKPQDFDEFSILLAHGGDESHIPINKDILKWSGFDYIALGHIHKPEIIFEDLMAYSGSLEPLDRTETGSHGFIEGEISEEKQQIEFVPFAKRMYIQVEVMTTEEMSASEIKDRIETELSYRGKDNIYEVVLTGSIDPEIEIDFDDIKEDYLISDIIYETKSRWDYDQLAEENDLMIQKVAEILKEEPQALTFAMEALSYARER